MHLRFVFSTRDTNREARLLWFCSESQVSGDDNSKMKGWQTVCSLSSPNEKKSQCPLKDTFCVKVGESGILLRNFEHICSWTFWVRINRQWLISSTFYIIFYIITKSDASVSVVKRNPPEKQKHHFAWLSFGTLELFERKSQERQKAEE